MDYTELDQLIAELRHQVEIEAPQTGYWKGLWSLVGQIKSKFGAARYPTADEKQAAWRRLEQLVAQARERSERDRQERERRQRAWYERVARSGQARGELSAKISAATPLTDLERMIATVVLAPLLVLETALNGILGLPELDEVHADLSKCSHALKEGWQFFSDAKGVLLPADKQAAYEQLRKAQERLNNAWARWQEAKNRAHEERRRAWEARQEDRRERIEANIAKLNANLEKAEAACERSRAHLGKLTNDYAEAWSDSFRERCREWIDTEEARLADIQASMAQMRGWLEEERRKLP
jgi:hypothetical protein